MKTYTEAQKFFDDCLRYVTLDGKLEDWGSHYQRTSQMEFQLPEWKRFNLSIHAAADLDPDVDSYEVFFDAMKRHDAVCWWLIFHAEERVKYNKGELGYYDILFNVHREGN